MMLLVNLPETEYLHALEIQRSIVSLRLRKECPDVLLLLEHPATVTLGVRGSESDLRISEAELNRRGVSIHRTDRGGEATYHGPGQLVAYPILDLRELKLSVRTYVHNLEETVIRTLDRYGVAGYRLEGKPGVWLSPARKIASIGVRVDRRVTSHGFSLNVALDRDPCDFMVSCGMPDVVGVSLGELLSRPVSVDEVRQAVAEAFGGVFETALEPAGIGEILRP